MLKMTDFEGNQDGSPVAAGPLQHRIPVLLHYWRVAQRWKWLIAAIIVGTLTAAIILTLLATPRYTSSAVLEISRQQENIVDVEGVQPEAQGLELEFYQTQYSLLESRTLAERVAASLKLATDPVFLETHDIDIDDGGILGGASPRAQGAAARVAIQRQVVDALLDNVGIIPTRGSRLVTVTYTSPRPELSTRIVNSWVENFIQGNLDRRFDATKYARDFLETRLEQLRTRLSDSERDLVGYAQEQRIINIDSIDNGEGGQTGERSLVTADLTAYNEALAEATADRIGAQSRLSGRGSTRSEALTNPALSQMRERRAEVAAEYARLTQQFEPEYPTVKALAAQRDALDRSIAAESARVEDSVTRIYQDALEREQALSARVSSLKDQSLDQRRRSIQYNIYQREVDTNRELYNGLLQRYKEIGIAGGVGTNNIAIVDRAVVPERPSSPNLLSNLLLGLLAGIALAAIVVVIIEQIDHGVKEPADVTSRIGLPLLGVVPRSFAGDPADDLRDRKSGLSEAILSMQTSLRFATDHGVPRSLMITSTRAAEGKSLTTFGLATSLARTGKRVVIVDCDMRSPSVHKFFGLRHDFGLSNYLAGDDKQIGKLETVPEFGLSVMSAGPIPPNAAELLTSPRLAQLVETLTSRFDHVLLDAPPVLGLADALLIAEQVEGLIYVIEAGRNRSNLIQAALARLAGTTANIFGAVLTKFDEQKSLHGYGYDYGYSYGHDDGRKVGAAATSG